MLIDINDQLLSDKLLELADEVGIDNAIAIIKELQNRKLNELKNQKVIPLIDYNKIK